MLSNSLSRRLLWSWIPKGHFLIKKKRRRSSSEILKRTPRTCTKNLFCGFGFKYFSPLRGTWKYHKSCGRFEAEHPKKYQKRFFNPKRYDEHLCPCYIGVLPSGELIQLTTWRTSLALRFRIWHIWPYLTSNEFMHLWKPYLLEKHWIWNIINLKNIHYLLQIRILCR